MIVDDHAPVIRVMRLGLERAGFDVTSAVNGAECLALLETAQPDFLVTDIDMPVMNGRELCLAIESRFPDRDYPIIVLTARTELEHRAWTHGINGLDFMEKPVSIRGLVARIETALAGPDQRTAG